MLGDININIFQDVFTGLFYAYPLNKYYHEYGRGKTKQQAISSLTIRIYQIINN